MRERHCRACPAVKSGRRANESVRVLTQMEALALTLAIELPVLAVCARLARWPLRRVLVVGALASCLTHPLAWWAALSMPGTVPVSEFEIGLLAIEVLVTLAEALLFLVLLRVGWVRALGVSVLANGASALAGWWL